MQIGRRFGLSDQLDEGIYCNETGLFVGGVPLLERLQDDSLKWRVRSVSEINREVSRRYRLPVELNGKRSGLTAIRASVEPQ